MLFIGDDWAEAHHDVEIVDDWLFLYAKRDFSTLDPATWAWLFSVVGALLGKLAQWERWRDDRLTGGHRGLDELQRSVDAERVAGHREGGDERPRASGTETTKRNRERRDAVLARQAVDPVPLAEADRLRGFVEAGPTVERGAAPQRERHRDQGRCCRRSGNGH